MQKLQIIFTILLCNVSMHSVPLDSSRFVLDRTIKFPDSLIIAQIGSIDVNSEGNILVTDNINQAVYLFDSKGSLLKNLSPLDCNPGFVMRPITAEFMFDGTILMTNSIPWGYRFDANGSCLESMHNGFVAPQYFCSSDADSFFGFYKDPNTAAKIRQMKYDGELIDEFNVDDLGFPNLMGRVAGGGLKCEDDALLLGNVARPIVIKYSRKGQRITEIKTTPKKYNPIESDISSGAAPSLFMSIGAFYKENTVIVSLNILNESLLMIQYKNQDDYGFQIVNLEGEIVYENESNYFYAHVERNEAFRVVQPSPDESGNLDNPYIEVYKFEP